MKTLILCTVGLASLALAFPVQAQGRRGGVIMKALDADGDGKLSAKEIANAGTALRYLDDDGDGVLSKRELGIRSRFGGMGDMDDMGGMGDYGDFGDWGRRGRRGRRGPNAEKEKLLKPVEVEFKDGTATIPDRKTFKALTYKRGMVMPHLKGREFVKFQIEDAKTDDPKLYFINTETHPTHIGFMRKIARGRAFGGMRGALVHHPFLMAPNGDPGLYTFEFELEDAFSFKRMKFAYDQLVDHSPLLKGRLAYHPLGRAMGLYTKEKAQYEAAALPVFLPEDQYGKIAFLPLNLAESFGRLRLMGLDERPGPRDIVVYSTLPNEMPRVAGVITEVRQTPLSHVNLRAIQDKVPNAFVAGAAGNKTVAALVGKYVYYKVAADGYELREATVEEVNAHFARARPAEPQRPPRDLSVKEIRSLDKIGFRDASAFGVKAANLATLRTFGFPEGVSPSGYAVPFHFYDAFMKHNGLYEKAVAMRNEPAFKRDTNTRVAALEKLRKQIENGRMPAWMIEALGRLHKSFPEGRSIRCRSSTNNEDLPGFSGAGLYGSFTHHPLEGHLSKSIKQVYASLWNFRAYEEREFYRIDHFAAAMGVLAHPNFSDEQADGVAVTEDILYQTAERMGRSYYINVQVGEDLVTNPEGESIPEEILLSPRFPVDDIVVRRSNRTVDGKRVLSPEHLGQLRLHLKTIHREFGKLYGKKRGEPFAMEVEFKVTSDGRLSIKQARPWVF